MKILVVSDTHRKLENLKVILEREQPMDLLIHLGDAEGDEDSIAEMAGCRLEIVATMTFFPIFHGKKNFASAATVY